MSTKRRCEMKFNLFHYVMLSLVKTISGQRGKGTVVGILRGARKRSIFSLKDNTKNPLDERFIGLMERVPNESLIAVYDELLKEGLITVAEDMINGHWYPLSYITNKGKEILAEKEPEFLPKLEKVLEANRTLIEFQKELIPAENQPSQNGGKNDEE
jgi:uncharacterized protein YpbB